MISTYYNPPNGLPTIKLTVKNAKLLVLDWFDQKTDHLLGQLGQSTAVIAPDKLKMSDDNQRVAKQVIDELDEYFLGKRQSFDVPLDLSHGTDFQQAVWQTLCQIPYGQTISYKELACNIGKPTAFRACANANGKNLISLIVPCHRVIASDGSLGGYTGGVWIKQTLLDLESRFKLPPNP